MLAVEDALDGLSWAEEIGGLEALIARSMANYQALSAWVETTEWIDFLARDPKTHSNTSVCLKIIDPWFDRLDEDTRFKAVRRLAAIVAEEGAGYDIAGHRDAPAGLRIWCGATVEAADVELSLIHISEPTRPY